MAKKIVNKPVKTKTPKLTKVDELKKIMDDAEAIHSGIRNDMCKELSVIDDEEMKARKAFDIRRDAVRGAFEKNMAAPAKIYQKASAERSKIIMAEHKAIFKQFNNDKKSFTMYKSAFMDDARGNSQKVLIELKVPATAKRIAVCQSSQFRQGETIEHHKIRVSEAKVVSIKLLSRSGYHYYGKKDADNMTKVKSLPKTDIAYAAYNTDFKYSVGQVVKPQRKFSTNVNNQCASGIHGYMDMLSAMNHSH